MSRKICIAGFTGFVGRHLVSLLEEQGNNNWKGAARANGIDLSLLNSLNQFGDCDVVVNLAGLVGVENSWESPAECFRNNLLSTITIMDYARKCKARVIHVSSYVYGIPKYQPIDENHPVQAHNPYAASKIEAENICNYYSSAFGIPVTILRPFNLYGVGQPDNFIVPNVIDQALTGQEIRVHDLAPRRDYLWVNDFVEAIAAVIEYQSDGLVVFNIGSGRSYSTKDIVEMIMSKVGPRVLISENTTRRNELSECICDNSNFRQEYDWEPSVLLEEGIIQLLGICN